MSYIGKNPCVYLRAAPWVQAKDWPNLKQQIEWKQVPEAFN